MSILTPQRHLDPPASAPEGVTVDEYLHMVNSGELTDDDHVELLEGQVVPKMARNPPHDVSVHLVQAALTGLIGPTWICRVQSATTTQDSVPEPDAAVVRGPIRRYAASHPGPRDTALVVEVSDSTLTRDRGQKARIYAAAGIPVYWIVNLVDRRIEVFTGPSGAVPPPGEAAYGRQEVFAPGEAVPLTLDGREVGRVAVDDLLP